MTNAPLADGSDRSLTRDIWSAVRYYLVGRRTLFVFAAVLIVGGISLNWGWLVAAGLAPILLALLPCAVMCALGLCMHKTAGGKHSGDDGGAARARLADIGSPYGQGAAPSDLIDPVSQCVLAAATPVASVHKQRIYYFEHRANREAFEADPERYLAGSQTVGQAVGPSDAAEEKSHQRHGCC